MANLIKINPFFGCKYQQTSTRKFIQEELKTDPVCFTVHQVPTEVLLKLKEEIEKREVSPSLCTLERTNPVIGYHKRAGLKISDPKQQIKGRITFTPSIHLRDMTVVPAPGSMIYETQSSPFNEERDSIIYETNKIYTDEPLEDILKSYIFDGRDCYINEWEYIIENYITKQIVKKIKPEDFYQLFLDQLENSKVFIKK